MKKKFISFIVLLSLLLSIFSIGASASVLNTVEGSFKIPAGVNKTAFSGAAVYNQSYYNQLNAEQKNAYNAMDPMPKTSSTITITLITPITFTSTTASPSSAETAVAFGKVTEIMEPALNAYLRDNAIVFWLDLSGESNSTYYGINYSEYLSSGVHHWTIDKLTLNVRIASKYSVTGTNNFVTAVQNAVNAFNTTSTIRYDILKDIHDYLCNNIVYADLQYAHEPYGALVTGEAVCEGYAEAFKLLCEKYNIPCAVIMGEGVTGSGSEPHMWNYVQMENNLWYGVDVTWDDQDTIIYDYFLAGSTTVATSFSTKTFSQEHIEDGLFSNASTMIFTYPALSSTKYVSGVTDDDAVLESYSSLTINGTYLLGAQENGTVAGLKDEFDGAVVVADATGVALSNNSPVGTGCTVDVGSVTYTVVILGDVDGSGTITSRDYLMVKRAFLGTLILTTVQNKAACISGGATPTAVDYLKVKRHVIGTYNIFKTVVA